MVANLGIALVIVAGIPVSIVGLKGTARARSAWMQRGLPRRQKKQHRR
jgi:hypothetical protein